MSLFVCARSDYLPRVQSIPKVFHQIWIGGDVPAEYDAYRESIRRHHPDWEHRVWDDDEIRALIRKGYPWFLEAYDEIERPVMRADCGGYLILHALGGVYADMDMEFIKPIDAVLTDRTLVLCEEPALHGQRMGVRVRGLTRLIAAALMASVPGHPFWDHLMRVLPRCRFARDPLDATGPFALSGAVAEYDGADPPHIEPPERFIPTVDPRSPDRVVLGWRPELAGPTGETVAIHHWAGHWIETAKRESKWQRMLGRRGRRSRRRTEREKQQAWRDAMTERSRSLSARPAEEIFPSTGEEPEAARSSDALPTVDIITPARDVAHLVPRYLELLERLTYPADRLGLVVLEGDSADGTHAAFEAGRARLAGWRRFEVHRRDFGYQPNEPRRWHPSIQRERRGVIAAARNEALRHALREPGDFCLWLDADVCAYPIDIIERLVAVGERVVVPHCVAFPGGPTFDLNTFIRSRPFEPRYLEKKTFDGIYQPTARTHGRIHLEDVRYRDKVRVDGVGGTMLLVDSELHRAGAIFPESPYDRLIETEGFALQVQHMGVACWGLPNVEIMHPPS